MRPIFFLKLDFQVFVVTGGLDCRLVVHDVRNGFRETIYTGHSRGIRSLAWDGIFYLADELPETARDHTLGNHSLPQATKACSSARGSNLISVPGH